MSRTEIIEAARNWIGTPYQHQASLRGIGADCIGLVRGVWRDCIGEEPQNLPAYSPNWFETDGSDLLTAAMQKHFKEVPVSSSLPGDVLLFQMRPELPAKHCAILSARSKIIHAYWSRAVTETALVPWWQRRISSAFVFPEFLGGSYGSACLF